MIWPLLIEKAIAKEYEGYDNLEGGAIDYALMLITGNPAFRYNLLNEDTKMLIADNSLWKKLLYFSEQSFLLGAGTLPHNENPLLSEGLEASHAYAITDVFEFDGNKLLKLKNPWGMSYWCGDWSSSSTKWTERMRKFVEHRNINRREKRKESMRLILGECSPLEPTVILPHYRNSSFFISWEDFARSFEVIFVSISFDDSWNLLSITDKWEIGRAGGSILYLKTVRHNPQYRLIVSKRIEIFCLLTQMISPAVRSK